MSEAIRRLLRRLPNPSGRRKHWRVWGGEHPATAPNLRRRLPQNELPRASAWAERLPQIVVADIERGKPTFAGVAVYLAAHCSECWWPA